MVEITGDYCPDPEVICEEYISEPRDRCERFRHKVRCIGKPKPRHFCIDRFEYPNRLGKRPEVDIPWEDARSQCVNLGKRLCDAEEWTLACEGPVRKPYPFGFTRDASICNFDKPYIVPNNFAFDNPKTRAAEVARLNQSEPSGSRTRCVSDYGVYDMTGNVDEWVFNEHGSPQRPEYQSGLKGGYWGPVRNRCRPMTTDHNQWHRGYQIGFRCCNDVRGTVPESTASMPRPNEGT
jgi:formylglycine-generating enzyme required for sulfatase activity